MKNLNVVLVDLQQEGLDKGLANIATLQYESSRINGELIQLLSIYRMENNRMPVNIDEHFVIDTLEEQLSRN